MIPLRFADALHFEGDGIHGLLQLVEAPIHEGRDDGLWFSGRPRKAPHDVHAQRRNRPIRLAFASVLKLR